MSKGRKQDAELALMKLRGDVSVVREELGTILRSLEEEESGIYY